MKLLFRYLNTQQLHGRLNLTYEKFRYRNVLNDLKDHKICHNKEELHKTPSFENKGATQKINTTVYKRIPKYHKKRNFNIITFGSKESSELVSCSINDKTDLSFYNVLDNNLTQSDPTYCGVSNLVILLNALNIDPKSRWKGIWRWFSEENLHCLNLDLVRKNGINLDEFEVVSKCNGIFSLLFRPDMDEKISFKKFLCIISNKLMNNDLHTQINTNINNDLRESHHKKYPSSIQHTTNSYYCKQYINTNRNSMLSNELMLYLFSLNSSIRGNLFTLASYNRKYFNQTGDGHFTIINLINRKQKKALLNEIARFKYNSIWVNISNLYESLKNLDNITKLPRGYLICGRYY